MLIEGGKKLIERLDIKIPFNMEFLIIREWKL